MEKAAVRAAIQEQHGIRCYHSSFDYSFKLSLGLLLDFM